MGAPGDETDEVDSTGEESDDLLSWRDSVGLWKYSILDEAIGA